MLKCEDACSAAINSLIGSNPYRILGLPTNAMQRNIYKAANDIKQAAKLGIDYAADFSASWLAQIKQGEAVVQNAVGILQSPEKRLTEKMFWFTSEFELKDLVNNDNLFSIYRKTQKSKTSIFLDTMVLGYITLIYCDCTFLQTDEWAYLMRGYNSLIFNDPFWELSISQDSSSGFDKCASNKTINEVKESCLERFKKPILTILDSYMTKTSYSKENFLKYLTCISNLNKIINSFEENSEKVILKDHIEDILKESFEMSIEYAFNDAYDKYNKLIITDDSINDKNMIKKNKAYCDELNLLYIAPLLESYTASASIPESEKINDLISRFIVWGATLFTWTDDYNSSKYLLEQAKWFCKGLPLAKIIDERIKTSEALIRNKAANLHNNQFSVRLFRELYALTIRFAGWIVIIAIIIIINILTNTSSKNSSNVGKDSTTYVNSENNGNISSNIIKNDIQNHKNDQMLMGINEDKSKLTILEDDLKNFEQELNTKNTDIDLEDDVNYKNQLIDEYNQLVEQYKSQYSEYQTLLNTVNKEVNEYNSKLR